jgi:hypothetical protein
MNEVELVDEIEKYLKENKFKYNTEIHEGAVHYIDVFVGSTTLMIEFLGFGGDDVEHEIAFSSDLNELPITQEIYTKLEDVISDFEDAVEVTKRTNKGLKLIHTKLEVIKEICDEYDLNFDEILTINYDFEK